MALLRKRAALVLLCVLLACNLAPGFSVEASHVLFLSSYAYDWDGVRLQMQGVDEVLKATTHVQWLFMDARNTQLQESERRILEVLDAWRTEGAPPFDLLITGDDEALAFAMKEKDDAFAGIPVVFEGINSTELASRAAEDPRFTGVTQTFHIAETIRVANHLYPLAERVLAISDDSPSGKGSATQFFAIKDQFPSLRFEILDCSLLGKDEIAQRLGSCGVNTILLFLHCTRDGDGNTYTLSQAGSFLGSVASVPLFRTDECTIGEGSFGGAVLSFTGMGREAGRLALRVLGGEKPGSIPVETMPFEYLFDYRQLQRFSIKKAWLPAGSIMVNQPESIFVQHQSLLVFFIGILIFAITSIVALVILHRKQNTWLRHLKASQDILEMAIKQTSMYIADLDVQEKILHVGENMSRSLSLPSILRDFPESMIALHVFSPQYEDAVRDGVRSIENGMPSVHLDVEFAPTKTRGAAWYRMMIQTITEEEGRPMRAILIAADYTEQQKQIELFEREQTHPTLYSDKTLFFIQADITINKLLGHRYVLFPDPHEAECDQYDLFVERSMRYVYRDDRTAYQEIAARSRLIHAFANGDRRLEHTYRCVCASGEMRWVRCVLSLVVHPYTKHLLLYGYVYDIDDDVEGDLLFKAVSLLNYKNLYVINAKTGFYRKLVLKNNKPLFGEEKTCFEDDTDVSGGMKELREATNLDRLRLELDGKQTYQINVEKNDGTRIRLTFFYLDDSLMKIGCLYQDVTEIVRKEAEQQERLRQALSETEKANNAKSEFLSRMSHEMRTPLSAIVGLARLGLEQSTNERDKDSFRKIHESCTYLLGLINDVLDMSRIETARIELHPQTLTLTHFLESLDAIINPQCAQKHILFITVAKGDICTEITVDDLRFIQIFINVLGNAVKFTPSGGTVTLEMACRSREKRRGWLDFVVRDTGCGMTAEFQKRAFEPFTQERIGENRSIPGTGLGLAIVKNLVDLMGGTIRLESVLDKGTIVYLSFPMVWNKESTDARESGTEVDYAVLSGKRVLLAEDHPLNAEIAMRLLSKAGMIVEQAKDGAEAVSIFGERPVGYFRVVLMDVRMPVMDGVEATKAIRAMDRPDAAVPIIALTADGIDEGRNACRAAGMDGYVTKPFEPALLYRTLVDAMGVRK